MSNLIPFFIQCSIPKVYYFYDKVNNPVNLTLCTSISKGRYNVYPDNNGRPSIVFKGCNTEWVYSYEKDRDAEYERIVNNEFSVKPDPNNRPKGEIRNEHV